MKNALVILAPGFEEIEAITIIDLLRRGGVKLTTASIAGKQVTGSHNIPVIADELQDNIYAKEFDMVILPGGPGVDNLAESVKVLNLLKKQNKADKHIAAICAAPVVLNKAGLLGNKKVTSYPSEQHVFTVSDYMYENVVVDNKIITSRAVGTAIDFSLKLIEILAGKEMAAKVADKILYAKNY